MKEDNMTKSKTETGRKVKIIFEKLTAAEEKKVVGSATPEGTCGPTVDACGLGGPPNIMDC